MNGGKLTWCRPIWCSSTVVIFVVIIGRLTECAPVAKVFSRLAIDHDDSPVSIAVGDECLIAIGVYPDTGRAAEQRLVVAPSVFVIFSDG